MLARSTYHSAHLGRNVSVQVCGKPFDWNLRELQCPADLRNGERLRFKLLSMAVMGMGFSEAFATKLITFNAKLATESDFDQVLTSYGFKLHRGAIAAGMKIPRGKAIMIPGGDCHTLVVLDPKSDDVIACHAGLGELINIPRWNPLWNTKFAARGRSYDTVIEKIGQQFSNAVKKRVQIHVFCGISADHFYYRTDNPTHGYYNRKLNWHIADSYGLQVFRNKDINAGHIDLVALIRSQATIFGFDPRNVFHDGVCTASNPKNWYSHAARAETGRNLVIVGNRS